MEKISSQPPWAENLSSTGTLTNCNATPKPLARLAYGRHEAAVILGISIESLDRLTRRGLLNPSRALKRPLYSTRELERFLAATTAAVENA